MAIVHGTIYPIDQICYFNCLLEQWRSCKPEVTKFLMLKGKTPPEIHGEMKPVFLDSYLSHALVINWCRWVDCDHSNVVDLTRSGRSVPVYNDRNSAKMKSEENHKPGLKNENYGDI